MEHILITGLDGSGKSTILNTLAQHSMNKKYDVLLLPHIDTDSLNDDPELKKVAEFINAISREADFLKNPQLKAIAIFASMLLFKKLAEYKTIPGLTQLYCERHPLIDTGVYARFYAEKMGEKSLDRDLLARIDQAYSHEIEYLIRLIPVKLFKSKNKNIASLAEFITRWFFAEQKLDIPDLEKLFNAALPSKIFYLKTSPDILIQRLTIRLMHEAHETKEVLSKLSSAYDVLFSELHHKYPVLVEIINAGNARSLNDFQKRLLATNR
jgi:thymidylate kinase